MPSRSVLVVEDEAQQVEVLAHLLSRRGWSVHAAATGAAAVTAYRSQPPAVVLLDLGLPDMNGLEVLQLLRETDPEAVVVVLTGDGSIELDVLVQHAWPGNIRELKNVLEQALLVIGDNDEIQPRHLPCELRRRRQQPRAREDVDLTLAQLERRHVDRVLRRTGGNRTLAARMLGISRVGLYKKLQRYEEESAGQRAPSPTATSGGAPAPHDDPRHDERANRWNQRGEAE